MPTSLGPAEILVILVVALIVLGPKRLPEAGRQVGKAIAEVRKWSQGFQDEVRGAIDPDASRPSYPAMPPLPPAAQSPPATNGSSNGTTDSGPVSTETAPSEPAPTDPSGPPAGEPPRA